MKKELTDDNINKLCEKCLKKCKQSKQVTLVTCPNFKQKPQQLVFKFKMRKLNEK